MSETDLRQPGCSPLLAAADAAELAHAASGHGHHLADRDPLLPLVPDTRTGYEPAATAGVERVVP